MKTIREQLGEKRWAKRRNLDKKGCSKLVIWRFVRPKKEVLST